MAQKGEDKRQGLICFLNFKMFVGLGPCSQMHRLEEFPLKKNPGEVLLRMQAAPVTTMDLDQVFPLQDFGKKTG